MSLENHLTKLEERHGALDKEIAKELVHPSADELKLTEMKRKKLILRDEIAKLRSDSEQNTLH